MEFDPKRRKFLRSGAAFVAGGVAGGFLGTLGEGLYHTLFEAETRAETDRRLLSSLFDTADVPPSIYGGEGNALGRAVGINEVSTYLRFSSSTLVDFITNTLSLDRAVFSDNGDSAFEYRPYEQAIFLGSPVSNPVSRYLIGYRAEADAAGSKPPEIDYGNTETRWAFLFGEGDFGVYSGRKQVAGRYSRSTSKLVRRPVYKLVDKADRRIVAPSITDGMLANEWLTIVRRRDRNKFKTLIAGMHGNGTHAFFANFNRNIEKLYLLTERVDEYQVVVPVDLDHSRGLDGVNCTTGELDWSRAGLHLIG